MVYTTTNGVNNIVIIIDIIKIVIGDAKLGYPNIGIKYFFQFLKHEHFDLFNLTIYYYMY